MTAQSESRIGSTRSLMSLKSMAMLPSWRMINGLSSRHSGWHGRMPRSRQISAMTAPAGRRRTSAAICAAVGRRTTLASGSSACGAAGLAARGRRWVEAAGCRVGVSRQAVPRTRLASSAVARSRPRVMRARIRAMSLVPNALVAPATSVLMVRCWNEAASCRP